MADKFRITYPISVTFGAGEQPSSTKFNAINDQAKNGLGLIERAIGDPWNQSGDSLLIDSPLQMASIARAIGEQKYLNARFIKPNLAPTDTILVQQQLAYEDGRTRIKLNHKPKYTRGDSGDPLNVSLVAAGYDSTGSGTQVLTTNTAHYTDDFEGIITLGSPLNGVYTIEYLVEVQDLSSDGPDAFASNVIPSSGQIDWNGLKIVSVSAGKFLFVLPPRRPTSELAVSDGVGKVPSIGTSHPWRNTSTVDSLDKYYWYIAPGTAAGDWDDASPAKAVSIKDDTARFPFVEDPGYRYQLPKVIHDEIVNGAAGTILPSQSLFLWDNQEKTIVEGITFRSPEANTLYGATWGTTPGWVIQAESPILDTLFTGYSSSNTTDDPADYQSRFSIIAIGNSTAAAIDRIRYHELTQGFNVDSVARPINHYQLNRLQPIENDRGYFALPMPWRNSDDHPDYLSRNGASTVEATRRDRFNNAMMGNFFIAANDARSTGEPNNLATNSWGAWFGHYADGPFLAYRYNLYNTVADHSSVAWPLAHSALRLDNYPLALQVPIVYFGTNDGVSYTENNHAFRFFGHTGGSPGRVDLSAISGGRLISVGTQWDINAIPTGNDDRGLGFAEWISINSGVSRNDITFRGNDLNISATGGDSSDVIIGETNASTDLRVYNNKIKFGTTENAYIEYDSGSKIYNFREHQFGFSATINVDSLSADTAATVGYHITSTNGDVIAANGNIEATSGIVRADNFVLNAASQAIYTNRINISLFPSSWDPNKVQNNPATLYPLHDLLKYRAAHASSGETIPITIRSSVTITPLSYGGPLVWFPVPSIPRGCKLKRVGVWGRTEALFLGDDFQVYFQLQSVAAGLTTYTTHLTSGLSDVTWIGANQSGHAVCSLSDTIIAWPTLGPYFLALGFYGSGAGVSEPILGIKSIWIEYEPIGVAY